jgi:hypothetical protein
VAKAATVLVGQALVTDAAVALVGPAFARRHHLIQGSRRDPKKSTSRNDTTHLCSPPPSLPTQVIPNGILDPTEPARRNEALDHLKNSGCLFSNG